MSALAVATASAALAAVLGRGPLNGGLFVAAVPGYTLGRQWILRYGGERRQSVVGSPLVATLSALILAADLVLIAFHGV